MSEHVPFVRPVRLLASAASFAAVYSFGVLLTTLNTIPNVDQPSFELTSFYDDRVNRIQLLAGGVLLAASAPCFGWFVSRLVARTTVSGERAASLPLVGAGLFGSATGTGAVAVGLVAGELALRSGIGQPGPELERWLAELSYVLLLVPAMAGAAIVVLTCSRACADSGVVPRWLAYLGIPLAGWLAVAVVIALQTTTPDALLPLPVWVVAVAAFADARAGPTGRI